MKVYFDPIRQVLFIKFADAFGLIENRPIDEGLVIDVDEKGAIVGLESITPFVHFNLPALFSINWQIESPEKMPEKEAFLVKAIESMGQSFKDRYLQQPKDKLLSDGFEAFSFFLDHVMRQGGWGDRLDQIYLDRTLRFLHKEFKQIYTMKEDLDFNAHKEEVKKLSSTPEKFEPSTFMKRLVFALRGGYEQEGFDRKANPNDVRLVLSSLKLLQYLSEQGQGDNIVALAVKSLKRGNAKGMYNFLNEIPQVADKTASLFLRDILLLFELEHVFEALPPDRKRQEYLCLFPVDVWVKRVASIFFGISEKESEQRLKERMVDKCLKYGVSPAKFNSGAWFVSRQLFELLRDAFGVRNGA
jgi:uncharacterized protein YuzE